MNASSAATASATAHFADVTEMAGQKVSAEQLERTCHRYYWARSFVEGREVLETACGAGPGLGYLNQHARSVRGGDISAEVLARAKATYGDTIPLSVFDATQMPFADGSFDAVLLFEAIYYLPEAGRFVVEAKRVLRPGGHLLIVTANKDLYDFNRSPFSVRYYGVPELAALCTAQGFSPSFWGYFDASKVSLRQRVLRPVKQLASRLGLIPKTMDGKEFLKRIFFGTMVEMPGSIVDTPHSYSEPDAIPGDQSDRVHKVIYCAARLN